MNIPDFPERRELRLDDREIVRTLLARLQPSMSEMTFGGLYLFRAAHEYRITSAGGSVLILGVPFGGGDAYFLPPLGGDRAAVAARLLQSGLTMYGDDDALALVPPELRAAEEDRDSSDYVYLRRDLVELTGNRYHSKKNRLNYFARRHRWSIEQYAPELLGECLEVLDEWRSVHGASASACSEADAAREALVLAGTLGLAGIVAFVDGKVRGFSLGEMLNRSTSVCHFEKGSPFLDGIYQLLNREFCSQLFTGCVCVNREQDLGEPNLRRAKLSYHPFSMVRKWRVRWKDQMS